MQTSTDLSIKGSPLAAVFSNDHLAIASSECCLSFFHLNGNGTPHHLLKYDNPVAISRMSCQRDGCLYATLRTDGTLSLWDPFNSPIRPLISVLSDAVESSSPSFITGIDFSSSSANMMGSCDLSGVVSIYDTRAPFSIHRSFGGQQCANDSSQRFGACQDIIFSSNSCSVATRHSGAICLWDLRQTSSKSNPAVTITYPTSSSDASSSPERSSGKFVDCKWCGEGQNSLSTVWVDCDGAKDVLQWWSVHTGELEGRRSLEQDESCSSNFRNRRVTAMLPTPQGRGIVLSSFTEMNSAALSAEKNHDTVKSTSTGSSMDSLVEKFQGRNASRTSALGKSSTSIYGFPRLNNYELYLLNELMFVCLLARPSFSLQSLYVPPDAAKSSSKDASTDVSSDDGPFMQLADEEESSSCIEMKWGSPNRLVPSLHGGLELLMLIASSSSCALRAIALPEDVLNKFSCDGTTFANERTSSNKNRYRSGSAGQSLLDRHHQSSVHRVVSGGRNTINGATSLKLLAAPPRYSVSGLHRQFVTPSSIPRSDDAVTVTNSPSNAIKAAPEINPKHIVKTTTSERKNAPPRRPQKTPQPRQNFWGQLQNEVLVLEEALQKGHLSGLTISRIDQYARQITIEVSSEKDYDITSSERDNPYRGDSSYSSFLIISFPQNFPSSELFPSFTVRSLFNTNGVDDGGEEGRNSVVISLESELADVAKTSLLHSHKYAMPLNVISESRAMSDISSSGFLLDVARCFWNRVQQVWSEVLAGKFESSAVNAMQEAKESSQLLDHDDINGQSSANKNPTSPERKRDFVDDPTAVIDSRAYRVCNPVSSGGAFSSTGTLSLFGGSVLSLEKVITKKDIKHSPSSSGDNESDLDMTAVKRDEADESSKNKLHHVHHKGRKKQLAPDSFSFYQSSPSSKHHSLGGGVEENPTNLQHIKTYADLLLRQREFRTAYKLAAKRESEKKSAMARRKQDPLLQGTSTVTTTKGRGQYLDQLFGGRRGADSSEDSRSTSDSYSHEDSISEVEDEDEDEDEVLSDEEELLDESSESESREDASLRDIFNSSLDEIGAKLDRSIVHSFEEEEDNSEEGEGDDEEDVVGMPSIHGNKQKRLNMKLSSIVSSALTSTRPSRVELRLQICGRTRYLLAKEYTFKRFLVQKKPQEYLGSKGDEHYPFYHSLLHSNSDTAMIKPQEGNHLASAVLDVAMSKMNPSMAGKRFFSMNNIPSMLEIETLQGRTSVDDQDNRLKTSQDTLYRQNFGREESKTNEDLLGHRDGEHNVAVDAACLSQACALNSSIAKEYGDQQLSHIWHLLSVSFQIMSITKYSLLSSSSTSTHVSPLESCRIMVSCGVSKDWRVHSLGRPLFRRVFEHMRKVGDLQSLAILICTVGGPRMLAIMLDDLSVYASSWLDKILLRYADVLHQWQCHVHATEITKFVSRGVFDLIPQISPHGLKPLHSEHKEHSFSPKQQSPQPSSSPTSEEMPVLNSTSSIFRFSILCNQCGGDVPDNIWCLKCRTHAFRCSICEKVLRGMGFFCPYCGHGGHSEHVKQWFQSSPDCPTGCGCRCADYTFTSAIQNERGHFGEEAVLSSASSASALFGGESVGVAKAFTSPIREENEDDFDSD